MLMKLQVPTKQLKNFGMMKFEAIIPVIIHNSLENIFSQLKIFWSFL